MTSKQAFRTKVVALLGAAAFATWTSVASAAFIFSLDTGNTALSGYTGPFASVSVGLTDATHATLTYTSLTNSGNIYLLGDGGSVAANINAASFTLGTITGSNGGTGFTPGPYSNGGAGNEDGFGSFNLTINSFDGYTHSSDTISFDLTNTSGTWVSDSDVLTANANNALAAAHIFVTSSPADASNGALVTGFAAGSGGGGPPTNVPEPGTLSLLAAVLLGVGALTRSRRA
jgi:hypothetical protein